MHPQQRTPDMGTEDLSPRHRRILRQGVRGGSDDTDGEIDTGSNADDAAPTVESLQAQLQAMTADRDKWKGIAREHETKGKKTAKEYEDFRKKYQSEEETKLDEARKAGRAEALRETGSRLVDAEVRAALAGRNVDVDALLEGLDRGRFLGDDFEPKSDEIRAWVDKVAPQPDADGGDSGGPTTGFGVPGHPAPPDLGQGARSDKSALNGDPLLRDLKAKVGVE